MRILLVAAVVALSVSASQAQDAATPSATLVEQLKAAGELKDSKALEAPAPKIDSIETKADAKPAEQPVVAKPAVTPTPAAQTAAAPAAAPAAKSAEAKPVQVATGTKPTKKRVVRKRETDERKARRIAAKYGVYW